MQEFLTNNTVSCNLMSLTGYRTLVILAALLESPKSNDEINECLFNNQYIKEKFSSDTLRIYINSLREIGCEITKANKSIDKKYVLNSHPFMYEIHKSQLKALAKLYKNIYQKLEIKDVIIIDEFFEKLIIYIKNTETIDFLKGISALKNINKDIINELLIHCKNKNQITFTYNSPSNGAKEIELITDKLAFQSGKLYLWGDNLTHKEYSFFSLERILNINTIKLRKSKLDIEPTKIMYEIYEPNEYFNIIEGETILEQTENKITIMSELKNEFNLMQRILSLGSNCKVIQPESFKIKLIEKLTRMEAIYETV